MDCFFLKVKIFLPTPMVARNALGSNLCILSAARGTIKKPISCHKLDRLSGRLHTWVVWFGSSERPLESLVRRNGILFRVSHHASLGAPVCIDRYLRTVSRIVVLGLRRVTPFRSKNSPQFCRRATARMEARTRKPKPYRFSKLRKPAKLLFPISGRAQSSPHRPGFSVLIFC